VLVGVDVALIVGEAVAVGVPVANGVGLTIANGVGSLVMTTGEGVGITGVALGARNMA
jgi:hypothetical protein